MHRFFVPPDVVQSDLCGLPEDIAHQVLRVLRLRVGDEIILFCGDGEEARATIAECHGKSVTVRLGARRRPDVDLRCRLHVAVAALKGEKLDWVIQKLTELGAAEISLLLTERTVRAGGEERWPRRLERYSRIAREAAEQCGGVRVPGLHEPCELRSLLRQWFATDGAGPALILDPYAEPAITDPLRERPERVLLLIGPEGGFSSDEVEIAREGGATAVRMGRRVLRAETAAIAAAAIVASAME